MNASNLFYWTNTLHVSDGLSVHQQELKTVYTATGICQTYTADCLLGSSRLSGWFYCRNLAVKLLILILFVHFFILVKQVCVGRQVTGTAAQYEPWSSYGSVASVKFRHLVETMCSASSFGHSMLWQGAPILTESWVGSGRDGEKKLIHMCRGSNHDSPVVHSVASSL